ncbi:hypothetical protein BaRGS_00023525 [Batillaria attramentaria]|uniref:Uncharacterized protein n=1 Tax=Batillaria attramentaria TaxID=370345 RepID=A0ABD0KDT1_9CAEN
MGSTDSGVDDITQKLPQWMTLDADSDTKTPVQTAITGKIPKWVSGNLYRNGSGVYQVGETKLDHFFDGFSVLHRFIIRDGEVKYQSRILDSDSWVNSVKANRLVISQFASYAYPDPCKSIFSKMMSYLLPLDADQMSDNTAVNIVEHGDKLYAMTETTRINEVDRETLLKKSQTDLGKVIAVHMATAHPHFGSDGTMYNLGTSFNPASAYSIVAIPPKDPNAESEQHTFDKAQLMTTLRSRWNMHISYNHSFGMTENYFVILDQPITLNVLKVVTTNWRRQGFASNFAKFPEEKAAPALTAPALTAPALTAPALTAPALTAPALTAPALTPDPQFLVFQVVQRSDNQPLTVQFQTDPTFCFHFINCYEEEEHLVVDLCGYDDINIIDDLYLKNMLDKDYAQKVPPGTFRRYVLPINVTEGGPEDNLVMLPGTTATAYMTSPGIIHCTPDYITDDKVLFELPRINYEMCNGKKYRYAYGTSIAGEKKLAKVDLELRKVTYWSQTGYMPGEPIFVAKPGAKHEDDGVVLCAVLSELPDTPSFLLVLDGKTFKEMGRAMPPCDVKMALSFHGSYLPDKK